MVLPSPAAAHPVRELGREDLRMSIHLLDRDPGIKQISRLEEVTLADFAA